MSDREMISVDREALRRVLSALIGPPHHVRELQAIRGLPGTADPIGLLVDQFNAANPTTTEASP